MLCRFHLTCVRVALARTQSCAASHYCLTCGLTRLCEEYTAQQFTLCKAVDVSNYRQELARTCWPKFALRTQADAMEALSTMLQALHRGAAGEEECKPRCLAHSLFDLRLCEQLHCECGKTSQQFWENAFQLPLYAADLLEETLVLSEQQWVLEAVGQLAKKLAVSSVGTT